MIGQTISHYKILEKLGEGGMGVVYKAEDTKLDRIVALKFLPPDLTKDTEAKQRFIHEAKTSSSLDHNNICTIYEVDQTRGGQLFLAMAYYEGQTVKETLKDHPLPIDEAVSIAIAAAEGLAKAHEKGITHRDIKSDNLMVTKDGTVKIMDFGLARRAAATMLTKVGSTMGTVPYMSPEQALGEKVDPRTDIWSLGVVVYEMVSGRLPFKSDYNEAIVYSILNEAASSLTSLRSGVPMELDRIVSKAMQKNPGDRYQRIDEMLVDLRLLRKEIESGTSVLQVTFTTARTRKRAYLYIGIAGFVILMIVAGVYLWRNLGEKRVDLATGSENFKKLAILPFKSIRNDPEMDFLGFSLADEIITKLNYVKSAVVRPSSAVRKYEHTAFDLTDVAHDLAVEFVLTGSYLKQGSRFRLNAQLVNIPRNEIVWSEPLEVEYADIFTVQDSISKRIIAGLQLHLSSEEERRLEKDAPSNPLAYEYFLKAAGNLEVTAADWEVKIQLMEKSIELDSGYAPTWSSLGRAYDIYTQQYSYREGYPERAAAAYRRALSINSDNPFAISQMAIDDLNNGKVEDAMELLQHGLSVNPNAPALYTALGSVYRYAGLLDESIRAYERLEVLNPRAVGVGSIFITNAWIHKGDYGAAIAMAEKGMRYFQSTGRPLDSYPFFYQGLAYYYFKDWEHAFRNFDTCVVIEKTRIWSLFGQAYKEAARGNRERVLEIIKTTEERKFIDPEMKYRFAHLYALSKEPEKALKSLENSIKGGFFSYPYISNDPLLENIRATKEFQTLLADVKIRHEAFNRRFGRKL